METQDDDRDWRLSGEIEGQGTDHAVHALVEHLHEPDEVRDAQAAAGDDVVITHDGNRLFAYAYGRQAIEQARARIEYALAKDGLSSKLSLTHFSSDCDEWVDPDAPPAESSSPSAGPESRTLVATVGKMIREEFEQSMRNWADQLGLRCEIVEHPHLLSSQVAFTVTGPPRKLDEFADGLDAEERQTIRTERAVMLSPL
ncbi:MAG TPA: hypothetical protein VH061_09990 [Solirubrobacteraceae bacterium]|jgi:hypothetical protein|nr:hypothetical protein [Solirubrobacteraceae bacterium]